MFLPHTLAVVRLLTIIRSSFLRLLSKPRRTCTVAFYFEMQFSLKE
jgi:hypothetical protein